MKKAKGKIVTAKIGNIWMWSIETQRNICTRQIERTLYSHRKSALRAARNAAKRLNIEVVEANDGR